MRPALRRRAVAVRSGAGLSRLTAPAGPGWLEGLERAASEGTLLTGQGLAGIPVLAIAIMVFGLYTSLHLLPAYPENFMPFFVLGWLCVGVGWMLYLRRRNPRKLKLIGQIVFQDIEKDAEPPLVAESTT